jgi:hypothetical protein
MAPMTDFLVERQKPTINDESAVVQILTLLMLSFAIIFVVAHFVTKGVTSRRLGVSDAVLAFSMVDDPISNRDTYPR